MKKTNFRKNIILMLTMAIVAGSFASCGNNGLSNAIPDDNAADHAEVNKADAVSPETPAADAEAKAGASAETAGEAEVNMFSDDITFDMAERSADGETAKGDVADYAAAEAAMGITEIGGTADTGDGEADVSDIAEPELPEDDSMPFVLTAGEWNDNENWGFFTNLVKNGTVEFPAYGVDPRNRIEVTITGDDGVLPNEKVELLSGKGDIIWSAKTDKNGKAYLFYSGDDKPENVRYGEQTSQVTVSDGSENAAEGQGHSDDEATKSVEFKAESKAVKYDKTEVMFILDTTGSMGDEISYLQKDFSSIAEEVGNENVTFSVNFYRDEGDDYVTRCNPFTSDIKELRGLLNAEYADGGGDTPEAVAEILDETMTGNSWSEDSNKIAFLIFDAPPHEDKEEMILGAVKSAAEKGIHLVPVVASNSDRATELFGRAVAICTNSNYVFLTDDSGVGGSHLEPIIGDYDVELLHDIIVRNINEIMG